MNALFSRLSLPGTLLLILLAASQPARALVVSETASVVPLNLYTTTTPGSATFSKTDSAAFQGFDASLGTLTGVSFDFDFEFSVVVDFTGQGSGSGGLNVGYAINGLNPALAAPFQPFSSSGTLEASNTVVPASALTTFLSAYTFDAALFGGFGSGGANGNFSVSSSLDLAQGSVTANYTYTAAPSAIPEPSLLALLGISAMALGLGLRRRR